METALFLPGPEETIRLGRLIGEKLEAPAIVALTGSLGAGKTCLTQGLALGLGVPPECPVVSPTFTLANEYPGRMPLFHLDCYRIEADEFFETGLDEYFTHDGVTVLEWAEKIEPDLPRPRLEVELLVEPAGGRRAILRSIGPEYIDMIREIKSVWSKGRLET